MKHITHIIWGFFFIFLITVALSSQIPNGSSETEKRVAITSTARSVTGVPYRFNGNTPDGFDQIGFIVYVYYKNQVRLPNSIDRMNRMGTSVSPGEAKAGDIVFFCAPDDPAKKIIHAGIYLGKSSFIHMPPDQSIVRIDSINKGNKWAKQFVEVRSYSRYYIGMEKTEMPDPQEQTPAAEESVNSGGYEDADYR